VPNKLERFDIFSVPVYTTEYVDDNGVNQYLKDLVTQLEDEDGDSKTDYCLSGYTSFKKHDNILSLDHCQHLLHYIGGAVDTIHKSTGLSGNIYLQNSWLSINRKYSYHEMHNHLPSTWSGVYYVEAKESDANLTFVNSNLRSHWPFCRSDENNMDNSANAIFESRTNVLYIFPSYLEHMVLEQKTDNERITLSFNFGVD